jgi:hypothetical protein
MPFRFGNFLTPKYVTYRHKLHSFIIKLFMPLKYNFRLNFIFSKYIDTSNIFSSIIISVAREMKI